MYSLLLALSLRSKSSAARTARIFRWTSAAILSCLLNLNLSNKLNDDLRPLRSLEEYETGGGAAEVVDFLNFSPVVLCSTEK